MPKKKLSDVKVKPRKPLWQGPEKDGVTQSLLSKFLVCRERFRLYAVEGLTTQSGFDHLIGYGNMWHVCEEAYAKDEDWQKKLLEHCKEERSKFQSDQMDIEKWYQVCKIQFPLYIRYWEKHTDTIRRDALVEEFTFKVPLELPSGNTVLLRGKWDGVSHFRSRPSGIRLDEHKTKGDVDEYKLTNQLQFDLQTGFYLVALDESIKDYEANGSDGFNNLPEFDWHKKKLLGIRYNVIKRPLSGGKGS
jgi:hypothetical protein